MWVTRSYFTVVQDVAVRQRGTQVPKLTKKIAGLQQLGGAVITAGVESGYLLPVRQIRGAQNDDVPRGGDCVGLCVSVAQIVVSLPVRQIGEGVVIAVGKRPAAGKRVQAFILSTRISSPAPTDASTFASSSSLPSRLTSDTRRHSSP